jgi:hypothetical protein
MASLRELKKEIEELADENISEEEIVELDDDFSKRSKSKVPESARRPGGQYITMLIKTRPNNCDLTR